MVKKGVKKSLVDELMAAKADVMKIRFRKVLGETVPAHVMKNARKEVAKRVRLLEKCEEK